MVRPTHTSLNPKFTDPVPSLETVFLIARQLIPHLLGWVDRNSGFWFVDHWYLATLFFLPDHIDKGLFFVTFHNVQFIFSFPQYLSDPFQLLSLTYFCFYVAPSQGNEGYYTPVLTMSSISVTIFAGFDSRVADTQPHMKSDQQLHLSFQSVTTHRGHQPQSDLAFLTSNHI